MLLGIQPSFVCRRVSICLQLFIVHCLLLLILLKIWLLLFIRHLPPLLPNHLPHLPHSFPLRLQLLPHLAAVPHVGEEWLVRGLRLLDHLGAGGERGEGVRREGRYIISPDLFSTIQCMFIEFVTVLFKYLNYKVTQLTFFSPPSPPLSLLPPSLPHSPRTVHAGCA